MLRDSPQPFLFPTVSPKKITAAFDGGRITSDGGVMLLAAAEGRLGVPTQLTAVIPDGRDPTRIMHSMADILRARTSSCILQPSARSAPADKRSSKRHHRVCAQRSQARRRRAL